MSKYIPALLGALTIVIASPSQAALYDITYTGVVSSGYDQTGVFLGHDSDLTGQAFTAAFTLNYPLPAGTTEYDDGQTHYAYGGWGYGAPSFVSGKITINGKSDSVSGSYISAEYLQKLSTGDYFGTSSYDNISSDPSSYKYSYIDTWIQSTNDNYLNGTSFTQSVNYTTDSNDTAGASFQFYEYDYDTGATEKYAYGNLTPSNVTVSVSAVPEQSTWAMMITAFGFAGTAFRRRKPEQFRSSRRGAEPSFAAATA